MKKALAIIGGVILALVVAVAAIWGREIATISTVKSVDGNKYLYTMEYKAKYDLDDVIAADIQDNTGILAYIVGRIGKGIPIKVSAPKGVEVNCTSFQAAKAGTDGFLYGRNYDFFKNPTMVTISHPKNGYASIGVSDMSHFGYSLDKLPEKFLSKALCLAAIYAPVDGMNEKGLCTSIMALPKMPAQQESGKHKISTTTVMRLWLDRCATVDEALELLSQYDVRHDVAAGSGYHYMVADALGACAVVEFDKEDGWKTMIVRKAEDAKYMHVTNHLLDPKYYSETPDQSVGNTHSRSWWRYATAGEYLASHEGTLTADQAAECLALVHWKDLVWDNGMVEDTQYSCVYDQQELTLSIRNWNDYEKAVSFSL
ncbi:MAG: linear amide C-N hydrolase [Bacteroidales bacterium]|nr:linear amide C-N hydrolase [Candidatus Cryptobacteroides aphodequi]